ncbi:MAG: hypothetical protein V4576_04085 [Patescibacteria group bacterium]
MLKSTFDIYTAKFAENIRILTPVIIIEVLIWLIQILAAIASENGRYMSLLIISIFALVLTIAHWLIYTPAAFRTFQKRADGEPVTIRDSIAFQKNNKWKYVVLTFWTAVFMIWYALISILPIVGGLYFGLGFAYIGGMANMFIGTTLMFVGIAFGLYMVYLNYAKIFFAMNVYFAKDKSPRESVRESIYLGEKYRNQIWKYMIGVLAIGIIGFVVIVGPTLAAGNNFVIDIWRLAISLLFITPMMYIYMSKAYLSILVLDMAEREAAGELGDGNVVEEVEIIEVVEITK